MRMSKTRWYFVYLLLPALLGLLYCAQSSYAGNRALDVCLQTQEKERTVLLRMDHFTPCTIESPAPGKIVLDVRETVPGPLFKEHLKRWADSLGLVPGRGRNMLLFMKFPKPVREVRCAWLQGQQLLFLRFFLKEKEKNPSPSGACVLGDLRFGIRKRFVRTVMDLTARPQWRFSFGGADKVDIALPDAKNRMVKLHQAPWKNMKGVHLKSHAGELRISLQFETAMTAFRLFWLDVGSRLVLDSFHTPDAALVENVKPPSWFGRPEKPVKETAGTTSGAKTLADEAISKALPVTAPGSLISLPDLMTSEENSNASKDGHTSHAAATQPVHLEASRRSHFSDSAGKKSTDGLFEIPSKPERQGQADQTKKEPEIGPEVGGDFGPRITISIPKQTISAPQKSEKRNAVVLSGPARVKEPEKEKPKFEPKEAALYGKILQARDLHRAGEALDLIHRFLTNYPNSDVAQEILFMKANILFSQVQEGQKGMLDRLVEAYQDVINRFPRSDLALESYVKMAKAYAMKGNHYLGISCLDLAIRRYQDKTNLAGAYLERGEIYLEKNLSEKAVEDFKTVLTRYPSSRCVPFALFGIARYLQARGLYGEAQERLTRIQKLSPDFFMDEPNFLSVQAQNFLYLKEYPKARSFFYRAVNLSNQAEGNDLLLVHIGDTYLQESRRKKAESFYTQVKKSFPGSEGASIAELRLGDLHGDVDKFKEVEKKQLNAPIAEIATLKVANAYYKSGLYQKAMEALKGLTEKPPKNSMLNAARSLFGQAAEKAMEDLFKQGKFSEVIALFRANEALLKGKIRPGKQILVAQSLQEVKEYSGAISAYRDLDPADLSTDKKKAYYLGLADCLWLSGLSADSIRVLEGARKAGLSSESRLAVTRSLAGRYAEEKRFNEAYQLYAAMIQGKKNLDTKQMADCYLSMGEVLNAQGKYPEARAVLNRSIALSERTKALKPVLLSSLGKLGESYLKEGRYRDALQAYTQALGAGYEKDKPGFWDVKLGQAEALMKMGERTAAENVLNGVYEERGPDTRYWDLRFHLAQEYVKAGNLQTGEKLLREVSEEGTPALQSDAQIKLGSLSLRRQLEKLSIWPQLGDQEQRHAGQ